MNNRRERERETHTKFFSDIDFEEVNFSRYTFACVISVDSGFITSCPRRKLLGRYIRLSRGKKCV
jgi:hypothetical protein